jgi:nucleosome binding factor SPN SPT16 subunit
LADLAEKAFSDRKVVGGVDLTHVETAYSPIVQSGSTISMKLSAQR